MNHSVDTDAEPEIHENMDKPEIGELKSKPAFKVELIRGDTTINVLCSFVPPTEQDDGYSKYFNFISFFFSCHSFDVSLIHFFVASDDAFGLDELSIYNGEWNENVYSVSGEVLDSVRVRVK